MGKKILMLDPSAIFGYAFGDPFGNGGPPFSGTFALPKSPAPVTERLIAMETWLMDLIKGNEITDVFIEQNFIPQQTSFQAVSLLAGYVLFAGTAARRCRCNCSTVELSTWRSELGLPTQGPKNVLAHPDYQHLAGRKDGLKVAKRLWVKDRAKEYVIKRGSDPKDDNEADACAMYYWKMDRLRRKMQSLGTKGDLFDGVEV